MGNANTYSKKLLKKKKIGRRDRFFEGRGNWFTGIICGAYCDTSP